ncbi:putative Uracil DNA glycosylase superfamily protein (plasmid) [Caballeronia sp. S22]
MRTDHAQTRRKAVLDSYYAKALALPEPDFTQHFRELSAPFLLSELLRPDLIIFGCGHRYDRAVKAVLPERQRVKVEPKALWHFPSNNIECLGHLIQVRGWPRPKNDQGLLPRDHRDRFKNAFVERLPRQNASA